MMQKDKAASTSVVVGRFRRTKAEGSRRRNLTGILICVAALGTGLLAQSPALIAAGMGLGVAVLVFGRLWKRPQRVKVTLAGTELRVRGAGYDIQLMAPFRFKTGVKRKAATERGEETCFVRMVLDVRGKPLVFEEQVLAGYVPPPLDEIVGISSALGIAELRSVTPYPGTLWALIERMEALSAAATRAAKDEQVESLLRVGRQQVADRAYDAAIETFSAVIRQQPDSALAYYSRGGARYAANRDLEKAISDLTTALRLDPKRHGAYRMRGLVRARRGDWSGLRDDCSLALQLQPQSAELFNLRGTACYRLQDYEAALSNYEKAIALEPNKAESYYNRGLARRRRGELAGALADFKKALGLNPVLVEARRELEAVKKKLIQEQASTGS